MPFHHRGHTHGRTHKRHTRHAHKRIAPGAVRAHRPTLANTYWPEVMRLKARWVIPWQAMQGSGTTALNGVGIKLNSVSSPFSTSSINFTASPQDLNRFLGDPGSSTTPYAFSRVYGCKFTLSMFNQGATACQFNGYMDPTSTAGPTPPIPIPSDEFVTRAQQWSDCRVLIANSGFNKPVTIKRYMPITKLDSIPSAEFNALPDYAGSIDADPEKLYWYVGSVSKLDDSNTPSSPTPGSIWFKIYITYYIQLEGRNKEVYESPPTNRFGQPKINFGDDESKDDDNDGPVLIQATPLPPQVAQASVAVASAAAAMPPPTPLVRTRRLSQSSRKGWF